MKLLLRSRTCLAFMLAVVSLASSAPGFAAAIHDAAARGELAAVREALAVDPAAVSVRDENGRTPLHWACRGDHLELVAYLLDHGADVNAVDDYGNTPLHNLAHRNLAPAIRLLLQRDPKLNHQNHERNTALHYAAAADATEAVEALATAGADLELRDDYGRTALILCARERGGHATARALIGAGANINSKDDFDATALDLATWRGKREVVDLLLDSGARLPRGGQAGRRLLIEASAHGLTRLFLAVVNAGTRPDFALEDGGTLLQRAAAGGSVEVLEQLLEGDLDVNHADRYGWTALHYAARNGRVESARLLISMGADTDARNLMGQTPCNVAEEMDSAAVIEMLHGPDGECASPRFPLLEGPYLGQQPPGDEPQPYAIGIVSSVWGLHSAVSFSPTGDLALWAPMVEVPGQIYSQGGVMMSELKGGRWMPPRWAPFTGAVDGDVPFFTPDGRRVYFIASRAPGDGSGSVRERIWYSDRLEGGWSDPRLVDAAVNDLPQHWQFAVDRDHAIYFSADLPTGLGGGDLYVSTREEGRWSEPVTLGAPVNTAADESTPFVAPDGSYLLLQRDGDLYVSHRTADGGWTEPRDLGAPINTPDRELCPIVSPDGKYLFFLTTRDGGRHVWWVSTKGLALANPTAAERREGGE